ncbi:uncharacterized protein A4U43_C05F34210 [Asparagus officinalis]|uniref:Autophagy protein ATG17-like domain-containing protein n=1 Tax=Asparagus officinalis TaxID=4686 RepID=A0A5P1EWR6_ASPOF|nr:uncharacterized protein A4U43_C05F34210 [Asparagus officinalis]
MMSSNSTISTDEFVPGRKLVVHLAQNGHTMEFECGGSTPVDSIQRNIESLSGVPFADQLLMCGKVYLDPQQPLAYYKLPQDNREVFVYNKARLLENSPQPPPESVEVPNAVVPPLSSRCNNPRRFDDVSDPALVALGSYERKFRYHYNFADAFHRCTAAKYELCNRLLREQLVQERALETVRGNLEFAFKKQQQRYSEFIRCFTEQHRVHAEILANLGRDMDRLRSLSLHPAVQSERRKCLLDLVKEDELIKWAEVCINSHKQFENKVSQLKMNFGELKKKVESVFSVMSSASSKDLEALIKDHQKFLNEQELIKITLSKDVNTVVKLVNDSVNHQLSSSLRPHDAISGLGPIYEAHEKNCLPKVQNCDNHISKLLDTCKEKKNNMNLLVHVSMQKVKSTQISIKELMNKLHAFEEAVGHQEKEFEHLKFVNGVGHAYRACLAEVIRRKSSSKLYMGLAGQLQERLATEREAEIRRREGFYKAWSKYIPHDILATMGLLDSPNQCDVNMVTQFDKNLLEIDVADVDRYAPQAVVGLPLKSDKKKLPKSNLATSSESCNFNKSEESGLGNNTKDDFDGLFDGCESIDIAGTSKIEVENARLKAELASAIVFICTFNAGIGFDPFEKCEPDEMLKDIKEKTAEALQSKDEYVKHLQSILNRKQEQCSAYEKRIQELEQRLEDQYAQGQKFSVKDASESVLSAFKTDGYGESNNPCMSSVSMDEGSSTSALDPKLDLLTGETGKTGDSGDENMTDISGILNMQSLDPARNFMDASMQETPRDEQQVSDTENNQVGHQNKDILEDVNREVKMTSVTHSSGSVTGDALGISPSGVEPELSVDSETRGSLVFNLQNALADKSNQFIETENQLKAAMKEISSLRKELDESQVKWISNYKA